MQFSLTYERNAGEHRGKFKRWFEKKCWQSRKKHLIKRQGLHNVKNIKWLPFTPHELQAVCGLAPSTHPTLIQVLACRILIHGINAPCGVSQISSAVLHTDWSRRLATGQNNDNNNASTLRTNVLSIIMLRRTIV